MVLLWHCCEEPSSTFIFKSEHSAGRYRRINNDQDNNAKLQFFPFYYVITCCNLEKSRPGNKADIITILQ